MCNNTELLKFDFIYILACYKYFKLKKNILHKQILTDRILFGTKTVLNCYKKKILFKWPPSFSTVYYLFTNIVLNSLRHIHIDSSNFPSDIFSLPQ